MKKIRWSLAATFFVVTFFIIIMAKSTKVAEDDLQSTENVNLSTIFESHLKLEKQDIIQLQVALKKAKYYVGEINGILTAATKRAIRKYQKEHHQQVTGEPTEQVLKLLGISSVCNLKERLTLSSDEKQRTDELNLPTSEKKIY